MIVQAENISVRRGTRFVVEALSLSIRSGELVGLLGPNGAGKTSLLRALCGLDPLDAGRITYAGRTPAEIGRRAFGCTLAYLPQSGRIHWPLPVEEVVALGRLPHGAAQVDDAVRRAMAAADVLDLSGRPTGSLSGGERARVLLARALAVEAPVLLADEPVAALDPYHQLQVMELLRATARAGTAVVAVLHDLTLAGRFCDRLAVMAGGRLMAEGPARDVLASDTVETAFGVTLARGLRDGEPYVIPWRRAGEGP